MDKLTLEQFGIGWGLAIDPWSYVSDFDCIKVKDKEGNLHVLAGGGLRNDYKYKVNVIPAGTDCVDFKYCYKLIHN